LTNQVSSKGAEVQNGPVFVKSGDRYFLYQVHNGREIGQQVVRSGSISATTLARQTVALKPAKS
jgi:hypothetical protein